MDLLIDAALFIGATLALAITLPISALVEG